MTRARLAAAALLVVAVLSGLVSGAWPGAVVAILALCASMLLAARAAPTLLLLRVGTFSAAALGFALGWLGSPAAQSPLTLPRPWSAVALAAVHAATFRLWMRAPEGGFWATFIVGLVALVACGQATSGGAYPAAVVAYLLLALAAQRAHDDVRADLRALPPRAWLATLALTVLAIATTVGIAIALPPASVWSRDRLLSSLGDARTGLGDRMVLGSLEGMLQSDEVVARVYTPPHGPPTDYLRGVVYDNYQAGQWASSSTTGTRTLPASRRPAGPATVRVVLVSGPRDRYLVPLGAHAVALSEGTLIADRFGAFRAPRGAAAEVSFDLEGPPDFPPDAPSRDDLRMPVKLAGSLRALVGLWTHGLTTPREKVDAMAEHLRADFTYSLTYERKPGDPLLDFLNDNRQGHCEYFASAMALLARAAGIPSRVVAGYRVAEHNPLGNYDVVRERNAHAWVEVHLPGEGWQTVDPTPPDLLPQNQAHPTPFASAVLDLLGAWWGAAKDRLGALSLWHLIVALLVTIVVGLAVRRWQQRSRRAIADDASFWVTPAPAPSLVRLLQALARAGATREVSEPIETFARRLEEGRWGEARGLLLRYAALRYGGIGDAGALTSEMETCAARLREGGGAGG